MFKTKCSKCGAVVLTHTVCPECGSYKGKVVSIKSPDYVSETEVKEEPKKAKRTTKKAKAEAEAVEVKAEEKVEAEEKVKAEEKVEAETEEVKAEENKAE